MAHAHCVLDTLRLQIHTSCVILLAFPLQQWLHENASMLCYTYIAFLVIPLNYVIITVMLSARSLLSQSSVHATLRYTNLFPDHRRCHELFPAEKEYVPTVKLRVLISLQFNLHYLFEEFLIADLQLLSRSLTKYYIPTNALLYAIIY
jgi:hypothetical protein